MEIECWDGYRTGVMPEEIEWKEIEPEEIECWDGYRTGAGAVKFAVPIIFKISTIFMNFQSNLHKIFWKNSMDRGC